MKAADVTDDSAVDISDSVYLLNFLFLGGSPPPPPFPTPGEDPTPDDLTCGTGTITELTATPFPPLPPRWRTLQLQVTELVGGSPTDLTAGDTGTTYATDKPGVAFAYRDGLIQAKRQGSATVTVRNEGEETTVAVSVSAGVSSTAYRVLAVNDLGMHCIDREFSIYSILPPFNVLHAQVLRLTSGSRPILLDAGDVELRYSPVLDEDGYLNSTSIGKTSFWTHAPALFGMNLEPGEGIFGHYMPNDGPAPGPQPIP